MNIQKSKRMEKISGHRFADFIGCWPFIQETGGQIYDLSGNVNTGTLWGNAHFITAGDYGYDLDFDGVGDCVDILNENNFDFERTDSFSIITVIKTNTTSVGSATIIGKQKHNAPYNGWSIDYALGSAQAPRFILMNSGGNQIVIKATTAIDDGLYYHLVVTYDGSSTAAGAKIYINSVDESVILADTLSASILNNIKLQFAGRDGGNNCFTGQVNHVIIYDYTLSPARIILHYQESLRMLKNLYKKRAKFQSHIA